MKVRNSNYMPSMILPTYGCAGGFNINIIVQSLGLLSPVIWEFWTILLDFKFLSTQLIHWHPNLWSWQVLGVHGSYAGANLGAEKPGCAPRRPGWYRKVENGEGELVIWERSTGRSKVNLPHPKEQKRSGILPSLVDKMWHWYGK